jgi:hypothetical protein
MEDISSYNDKSEVKENNSSHSAKNTGSSLAFRLHLSDVLSTTSMDTLSNLTKIGI